VNESTVLIFGIAIPIANIPMVSTAMATVVASVVAFITCLFNNRQTMRVKHKEYVADYYKYIVKRRIAAYELLENFIVSIKIALISDDDPTRPYHKIFSHEEDFYKAYKLLLEIQALWLSQDAYDITREMNYILFRADTTEKSMTEYGKENYENLANLRSKLENIVARDMLRLHDVETFLKEKKERKSEFIPVVLFDSPPKI